MVALTRQADNRVACHRSPHVARSGCRTGDTLEQQTFEIPHALPMVLTDRNELDSDFTFGLPLADHFLPRTSNAR